MREIDEIKDAEYDKIVEEINAIYQQEVLLPIKPAFINFFKKIQNFEDGYRTDIPSKKIEIVSIFYYAPSTLSFIFAMSDLEYYKQNNDISRPELHTESYGDYDVEELVMRILKKHNIEHEDLDYYDVWEDQFTLNHDFLLACWQEAKTITNSKLYGFLFASDFAGGTTNLDNGDSFFGMDNTVEKYLTDKGIHIKKDL
ncbi:hypothetical protein U8527_17985 [Kordia algicida OT-1]|uniref:Uncharacterized protein n=1 Tax=Kordia algicida OT-1 TaxID=391587 RepID=A9DIE1_9FLAO|nr:hypothetical protein [Kordia algicida]EDP97882.1 hypothetical protein KAOT1_11732 [Kordia algicida OT-1]